MGLSFSLGLSVSGWGIIGARCFDICITPNAPPPLPEFSPRITSGSVGNRAVHARKFPLEGTDFRYQILIEPKEIQSSVISVVEPSAQLN